jgi:hypothetical protein
MSASKEAKSKGFKTLRYVYTTANVDKSTFNRWYTHNRVLFDVVLRGVKALDDDMAAVTPPDLIKTVLKCEP